MQRPFSICNNMQKNMQTLIPICKILQGLYSAYSAYICTAQFADGEGFRLFQWGRPERFPLKCEESQRTFLAQPAIKPRTELTVVDGGTSTAGRWDGEQSNDTHTKKNITYLIC